MLQAFGMIRVLVRSKGPERNLLLYYRDPETNREVSKDAGTRDRRQAERAAALWEAELQEHRGVQGASWDWFIERISSEHLPTVRRSTAAGYRTAFNHFRRVVAVTHLDDVTTSVVSAWQAQMLAENKNLASLATQSRFMRAAFNWAARVGLMKQAPFVKVPKNGKRLLMRSRPVTEAEYLQMHAKADSQLQRFMELLWLSGLRLEEATRLSWDSQPVQVAMDAKPYPQLLFFSDGHKAAQDEITPMTPDLFAWLKQTPARDRRGRVAPIITRKGTQRAVKKIGRRIADIGEECGIVVSEEGKFASAHDLRRAFGTRWAQRVRPVTLQRLMRHKSIETTLRYYVNITATDVGAELWSNQERPEA